MEQGQLTQYEVTLLDKYTENKWTMMFSANDFAHAEEQALDALGAVTHKYDEIISITKDYDASV